MVFPFLLLNLIGKCFRGDIFAFVEDFFAHARISSGCNYSFLTLIPMTDSPLVVSDFCPINLILIQHKIIVKILALHLA